MRCWVLVVVLACDSGARQVEPIGHGTGSAGSAAPIIIVTKTEITYSRPNPVDCPVTYPKAGACTTTSSCSYAEGDCYCGYPPHCGGDKPPPPSGPKTWQCVPAMRPDGCSGTQPNEGSPCATEGKSCDYTCACLATSTCKHRAWHNELGPCMP